MFMQSNNIMKLKYKIGLLILTLILIITSSIFVYALLQEQKEYDEINFTLGKIDITLSGELMEEPLYPGIDLIIKPYVLNNNSTILIDLKVTVELLIDNVLINPLEYEGTSLILLNGDLIENTYTISNIQSSVDEIIIIESLILDGYQVKNNYSGKTIEIRISFAAKQSEYANWNDIPWP